MKTSLKLHVALHAFQGNIYVFPGPLIASLGSDIPWYAPHHSPATIDEDDPGICTAPSGW